MAVGNTQPDGSGSTYWLRLTTNGRLEIVGPAAHDAAVVGNPLQAGGVYRASDPALNDGDIGSLLIDALGRLKTNNDWTPDLQSDEGADDSDKKFTVPASTEWRVKWIWVEYTSDANAGNRQVVVEIQDGSDDVIAQVRAGIVQAASLTRYYLFAPHVTELAAFRDTDCLSTIMPEWVLPVGFDVRIFDKAAIAAATDDVVIQMMVESRPV